MKVVITGSRDWQNARSIMKRLLDLPEKTILIHGCCRGADDLCGEIGGLLRFKVIPFPANFKFAAGHCLNPEAGPIRNRRMLDERPDLVIAFHPDLQKSKGTKDCVTEALRRGIQVEVINE